MMMKSHIKFVRQDLSGDMKQIYIFSYLYQKEIKLFYNVRIISQIRIYLPYKVTKWTTVNPMKFGR